MESISIPKDDIERRAYEIYLDRGRENGHALEHWLLAKVELQEQQAYRPESVPLKGKTAGAAGIG